MPTRTASSPPQRACFFCTSPRIRLCVLFLVRALLPPVHCFRDGKFTTVFFSLYLPLHARAVVGDFSKTLFLLGPVYFLEYTFPGLTQIVSNITGGPLYLPAPRAWNFLFFSFRIFSFHAANYDVSTILLGDVVILRTSSFVVDRHLGGRVSVVSPLVHDRGLSTAARTESGLEAG